MIQSNTTAQQGNLFESANQVTNSAVESAQQPVFAMVKGNIGQAHPATGELIAKELENPLLHDIVKDVRAESDEAKQKMLKEKRKFDIVGLCPHFSQFRDDHRTQADAIPECCTYMTCVDVDNRDYGQRAVEGALRLNEQPGKWRDKLLYIENSLRGGGKVHIWLRCPVGMTVAETQEAFCKALEIPCDSSVQQKQSFILMTGDVVYQSDLWLRPLTQEQIEAHREAFRLRGLGIDGWPAESTPAKPVAPSANESFVAVGNGEVVKPCDSTDFIFEACMEEASVQPADLLIENEPGRHNSIRAVLSVGLPQLMTKAECLGQIRHRSPQYFATADCQRLVNDFYAKYTDTSARLTQFQRRVLAQSRRLAEKNMVATTQENATQQPTCDELTLSEIYASQMPPRMNRQKMPRLLKVVTSRTPDVFVETVSQACFPPLMAHPVGLSFRHPDKRSRELRGNCVTIAETGAGKSCNDLPIKHIMADVVDSDVPNRKKQAEYNEKYNTRNSNMDKPRRPKLKIRNLMPNLTQAALAQRTQDAEGAPLYCRLNELEQFDKIENASGTKNQFTNMKINDDEGNDYGQERAGTQSVNAAESLFLNWNASTTPSKAIRYFRHVMNDGPISRLCLATIPDPGIGATMPQFGEYDDAYDKALKPFIDNLNKSTGYIDCRQARHMIERLEAECKVFAIASQDRVWDNLTHRALVHVFRKACCIFVANGLKWEKNIETWCRWSLHYDLWLKMHFFGDLIRQADQDIPISKRGPRNMLELLKDEFTVGELADVRYLQGKDREGTVNQIYQWVHRGLILHLTDDRYKKVTNKSN